MRTLSLIGILLIVIVGRSTLTYAQSSSSNYQIDEAYFGTGGDVNTGSGNYSAQQSGGALGVDSSSSTTYDANGGYLTQNHAFLEMQVTNASVSFGTLSDTTTAYGAAQAGDCNCSFSIRTYLSSQYAVYTLSNPPTNESGDILTAKSVLGVPSTDQGVEEFGINLVDNSSPDVGANPFNDPTNSFADGQAASGYGTTNQFKYAVGDMIARSAANANNPATGKTDYTISYIAKRKPITPAGLFAMSHDLVVVPLY